jgi:hypothetical protein
MLFRCIEIFTYYKGKIYELHSEENSLKGNGTYNFYITKVKISMPNNNGWLEVEEPLS